jgi:hypothetical protein
MSLASPDALAAARVLHAAAQTHYAQHPGAHAPGLSDPAGLPPAIATAWDALARRTDADHALLCPAFSFVLHQAGAYLEEGTGTALPTEALLPWQGDLQIRALCARALDVLPPSGILFLHADPLSAHQRLLLARLAPPAGAIFGHLLRRGRVCALLSFVADDGRFRLTAAARR